MTAWQAIIKGDVKARFPSLFAKSFRFDFLDSEVQIQLWPRSGGCLEAEKSRLEAKGGSESIESGRNTRIRILTAFR